MEKIIKIDGMSCGHCVASVTNALKAVNGVESAEVSLDEKQAKVVFDDTKVSFEDLKNAVEEQGFDVVE